MARTGNAVATNITGATTAAIMLTSNIERKFASVYNDSTANLYLLLGGSAASTTNFTVKLLPGDLYVAPDGYTGPMNGVWDAVNGAARVTEGV